MTRKATKKRPGKGALLAIDAGYGSTKAIASGMVNGSTLSFNRPSYAMPKDCLTESATGGEGVLDVLVGDEAWSAGVPPGAVNSWAKELSADYPETDQYKAMFHAVLAWNDCPQIEHIVTGLPVEQMGDPTRVARLKEIMEGKHRVTSELTVTVDQVSVVPQAGGAFLDFLSGVGSKEVSPQLVNHGTILIGDAGCYSLDYVVYRNGRLQADASGTSRLAVRALLEEVVNSIKTNHGKRASEDEIERALLSGLPTILVGGEELQILPMIEVASKVVAKQALVTVRNNLRKLNTEVDCVHLIGGGAQFYEDAFKDSFGGSTKFSQAENPSMANARGYFQVLKKLYS